MVNVRPRPAVNGVASADRVLTVLSAFQVGDTALTLVELVERTGLIKSTIMRLMVSLENHGYVNRMADGRYQLASEVMRLNAVYEEGIDLERHVMPRLHLLAERTGETASFYVRHGAYRMCQYRVNSPIAYACTFNLAICVRWTMLPAPRPCVHRLPAASPCRSRSSRWGHGPACGFGSLSRLRGRR